MKIKIAMFSLLACMATNAMALEDVTIKKTGEVITAEEQQDLSMRVLLKRQFGDAWCQSYGDYSRYLKDDGTCRDPSEIIPK